MAGAPPGECAGAAGRSGCTDDPDRRIPDPGPILILRPAALVPGRH